MAIETEIYATFAQRVYFSDKTEVQNQESHLIPIPADWILIPDGGGLSANPATGFNAEAYQNTATGEVIITFRGTDNGPDWITNISNLLN